MVDQLRKTKYPISDEDFERYFIGNDADKTGVAHRSRSGVINTLVNKCKDRKLPQHKNKDKADRWANIEEAKEDESLTKRRSQAFEWTRFGDGKAASQMSYPSNCESRSE